jgi:hypothetical protein
MVFFYSHIYKIKLFLIYSAISFVINLEKNYEIMKYLITLLYSNTMKMYESRHWTFTNNKYYR